MFLISNEGEKKLITKNKDPHLATIEIFLLLPKVYLFCIFLDDKDKN